MFVKGKIALLDIVWSLLTRNDFPKHFLHEIIKWSIYILNKTPYFFLLKIRHHKKFGADTIDHLNIFTMCPNFLGQKSKKLDTKYIFSSKFNLYPFHIYIYIYIYSKIIEMYFKNYRYILIDRKSLNYWLVNLFQL
jgi:hypothetical protein